MKQLLGIYMYIWMDIPVSTVEISSNTPYSLRVCKGVTVSPSLLMVFKDFIADTSVNWCNEAEVSSNWQYLFTLFQIPGPDPGIRSLRKYELIKRFLGVTIPQNT